MFTRSPKKVQAMSSLRSNRGFTLVEMVITVAVIAILVSTSLPSIFEFMRQRDDQSEEIAMQEIRKAIEAYLADKGTLPDDGVASGVAGYWATELAGYTNLSTNEIENDRWKRRRSYIMYKNDTRGAFGNKISVYYVSLHSKGSNGKAENTYLDSKGVEKTISGLGINGDDFAGSGTGDWWSRQTKGSTADSMAQAKVDSFAALRAGGDDHIMRFTNYANALEKYNETVKRLDAVTQALETYARSGYAEKVSECSNKDPAPTICTNGDLEKMIYYPRAVAVNNTEPKKSESLTNQNGWEDLYNNTKQIVNNGASTTSRRDDMKDLMNLLGLPTEYCCSAIDNSPFYYFSNPRARTSTGGCADRPNLNATKLPARILTTDSYSVDSCG